MDAKLAVKIKNLQREADALGVEIRSYPPLTVLDWVDDWDEQTAEYKGFTLYCNHEREIYNLDCEDGTTIKEWGGGFDLFEQEAIALVDSIEKSSKKPLDEALLEDQTALTLYFTALKATDQIEEASRLFRKVPEDLREEYIATINEPLSIWLRSIT